MLKKVINLHLVLLLTNIFICGSFAGLTDLIDKVIPNNNKSIIDKTIRGVFDSKNTTLNCFGIPIGIFANFIERLFTQKTAAEDVRFYFYSRENPKKVTVNAGKDFKIQNLSFNIRRKTVLITHGFLSSGDQEWVQDMKDAVLKLEDVNVIVVNWQKGSNTWNYVAASVNTKIVAGEVAKLLNTLRQKALGTKPDYSKVGPLYFVGHSLGAHISGHASYILRHQYKGWYVYRITGLDPAQPCFSSADPLLKLSRDDAQFVDVIHTNARNILLLGLGLPEQLGNLDFFPNGGQIQLGCDKIDTSIWSFLLLPVNLIKQTVCSHGRSHELFTDSIAVQLSRDCKYKGHRWNKSYDNITELIKPQCENAVCPEMGINSIDYKNRTNGTFFVPTSESPHYCDVSEANRKAIVKRLKRDKSLDVVDDVLDVIG